MWVIHRFTALWKLTPAMLLRLSSLNLAKKAMLTALLLLSVGLMALVYLSTRSLQTSLTALLVDQQRTAVHLVASNLAQKVQLRTRALQDVAEQLPLAQPLDAARMGDYLAQRLAIYRLFTLGVVVIGQDGHGITDYPAVPERGRADYSALEYFKEVMATGQPALGQPRVGRFTGQLGMAIAVPLKDRAGTLLGVMAAFVSLTDETMFDPATARLGRTGEFTLISQREQLVIAATQPGRTLKTLDELGSPVMKQLVMDGVDRALIDKDLNGAAALMTEAHLLSGRWVLVASLPTDEAFAPIRHLVQETYLVAIIILSLTSLLMGWLLRQQLGPLTQATQLLRQMSRDEKPLQALQVNRQDEIGEMLSSFNLLQIKIQRTNQDLVSANLRFQNLFDHMTNGFALHQMLFDAQGEPCDYRFLEVNPAFLQMTGLAQTPLVGRRVLEVLPLTEPRWIKAYGAVVTSGTPRTFEDYAAALDRWFRVFAYTPEPGKFAVIVEDITAHKRDQQQLKHLAYHDVLTGLPNRALFADRLQLAMAQARRRGMALAVGYMDLDHFKNVNDSWGHEVGDLLLVEVAQRLKDELRADDSISRFGGDEFAILLADVQDVTRLDELLHRLLERIASPYLIAGHTLNISMSLGITLYPDDDADADLLLRHADEALYEAKKGGRNGYRQYVGHAPSRPLARSPAEPASAVNG